MAGGAAGSIQAMITSLRNNKMLLRKKEFFQREERIELNRAKHKEALVYPEFNEELLDEIKLTYQRKKRHNDVLILFVLLSTIFICSIFVYYKVYPKQNQVSQTFINPKNEKFTEKQKLFIFLLEDGDYWFSQSHFKNAVFQYKIALNLYPNNREVLQRLQKSYVRACELQDLFCDETTAFRKKNDVFSR
jgi:hypothetical protein